MGFLLQSDLYLELLDKELDYDDIKELTSLFYRFGIDMKQLKQFINDKNKGAAEPWKKEIYSTK